jgi:hypothetical protein
MNKNYGVSITGGTVNAGSIAAGRGAVAVNGGGNTALVEEARGRVEVLVGVLRKYADELDGPDSVDYAQLVQGELEKAEPSKPKLLRWLARIAAGAGSVAAITEAVDAVRSTVEALT